MTSNTTKKARKYTPTTQRKRNARLLAWLEDLKAGVVRITEEGKPDDLYHLAEIASDFGRGFTLEKMTDGNPLTCEPAYSVNIDGEASTCECKGFLRWHHCRHVEALTALLEAGKLASDDKPTVTPVTKPTTTPAPRRLERWEAEIV